MPEKTVLLAEDNSDDVELARLAFAQEAFPYEIVVAEDGQAALDRLFSSPENPALVILDLKMPKVGGLEVLKAMREDPRLRAVPVVVLTTSDEERDRAAAETLGVSLYLKKPLGFDELREIVRRIRAMLQP
jgi:CheY-like chemotaxis protein